MPYIKLTETTYVEPDTIEMVRCSQRYGQRSVQVIMKRQDLCQLSFYGDEADEAWRNWKAYMQQVEEKSRAGAEDDQQ